LNGNKDEPYSQLHLSGELSSPSLKCTPETIQFQPVPLGTKTSASVDLCYKNFLE